MLVLKGLGHRRPIAELSPEYTCGGSGPGEGVCHQRRRLPWASWPEGR